MHVHATFYPKGRATHIREVWVQRMVEAFAHENLRGCGVGRCLSQKGYPVSSPVTRCPSRPLRPLKPITTPVTL
jgi:hypothetical protein